MLTRFALAVLFVGLGGSLLASEEEFVPWSEVRIVSPKHEQTGTVSLTAKLEGAEYKELAVEAFGKKYAIEKKDLARLAGFPPSSLVITHEAGYEQLGGHMVHFKWKRSYLDAGGKLVEEKALVSISKGKGLSVKSPILPATKE